MQNITQLSGIKCFEFFKLSVLVKLLILPAATAILLVKVWMYKPVTLFAVDYHSQELEQSLLHSNSAWFTPIVFPVEGQDLLYFPFMFVCKFVLPKGQVIIVLRKTQR